MEQKTFKGHLLDNYGDVVGAFPSVNVIQQQTEDALRKMNENINQRIIEYCLKININPDVLLKQKAEIELLQMKIEKMKCCQNCEHCYSIGEKHLCKREKLTLVSGLCHNFDKWELKQWQ